MVGLGQDGRQVGHAVGHLQGDIVAVVGKAGGLRQGGGPGQLGAVDVLTLILVGDVVHGLLAPHDGGGGHDGVHDGLVARAAADVVVDAEPFAHFLAAGAGIRQQQTVGGDDEARSAEAALNAAVGNPRLLQGVQSAGCADPFDGEDAAVFGDATDLPGAGTDRLPVDQDGAGAADADAAADLHAGEAHPPKNGGQPILFGINDDPALNAVDLEGHSGEFCQSYHPFALYFPVIMNECVLLHLSL